MIIVSYIYLCSIMKMKYKNDKMRFFNKYVVVAGFVSTGSIPVCIVPLTKKKRLLPYAFVRRYHDGSIGTIPILLLWYYVSDIG